MMRALLLFPLLLVACQPASTPADGTYTVDAVVRNLPRDGRPGEQLLLAHEAIPSFRDRQGREVGMEAMTMPFPAAPELLEGIEPGDAVRVTFEVRWNASPPYRVVALERLSAPGPTSR